MTKITDERIAEIEAEFKYLYDNNHVDIGGMMLLRHAESTFHKLARDMIPELLEEREEREELLAEIERLKIDREKFIGFATQSNRDHALKQIDKLIAENERLDLALAAVNKGRDAARHYLMEVDPSYGAGGCAGIVDRVL